MSENESIQHVSDTALWVAAHRAAESERPDALYRDPLAAVLVGERGREIARSMPMAKILGWIMVVRTVAIDRLILEALADGVDTVINLGAGLDTRPYRMELPASLKWIEIDFPHMVQLKNEKLANEKPRCHLQRIALDLSDREKATKAYAEIGAQAKKALIITEGVIAYLTLEQAGLLAQDLRKIESFRYWIQDFRNDGDGWRPPKSLKEKMKNAPLQFKHPDTLSFFAQRGWKERHVILSVDEGVRVGRKFPIPFPFNLVSWLMPKSKIDQFRRSGGYVLLQAN